MQSISDTVLYCPAVESIRIYKCYKTVQQRNVEKLWLSITETNHFLLQCEEQTQTSNNGVNTAL